MPVCSLTLRRNWERPIKNSLALFVMSSSEEDSIELEDVEELDPDSIKNPNMYHVMMGKKTLREVLLPTKIQHLTLAPADIVLAMADVYLPGRAGWDRILEVELDAVKNDYDYCLIDSPPSYRYAGVPHDVRWTPHARQTGLEDDSEDRWRSSVTHTHSSGRRFTDRQQQAPISL